MCVIGLGSESQAAARKEFARKVAKRASERGREHQTRNEVIALPFRTKEKPIQALLCIGDHISSNDEKEEEKEGSLARTTKSTCLVYGMWLRNRVTR